MEMFRNTKPWNKLALKFTIVLMAPLIFMFLLAPSIMQSNINPILQNLFALIPFIIILPSLAYIIIQSSRGKYDKVIESQ